MARTQFPAALVNHLLVAVHYSIHFDGGELPIEQANPRALKAAIKARLVEVDASGTDVALTDDGRILAVSILQEADVDPEDSEAVAEWAQSVSPRVKAFEAVIDTWSALDLHALESMINELRR